MQALMGCVLLNLDDIKCTSHVLRELVLWLLWNTQASLHDHLLSFQSSPPPLIDYLVIYLLWCWG
jgi:hypothetical protein